jgi:putative ABC transport system permease protein
MGGNNMLKNYFKVAFRSMMRRKGFSLLNISGLAIGMASAMLILLWVQNEMSYDRFYPNANRLYLAWNKDTWGSKLTCWSTTPKVFGPVYKHETPEVEKESRVNWNQSLLFTVGEKRLNVTGTMVDPDFLTMFSFPFVNGDANTALNSPQAIVLTEKLAVKLFGSPNSAMGKTIKIDNKDNYTVSAIMKDLPNNTQFDFEYLLPWAYMVAHQNDDSSWGNNSTRNYVLLKPNANIDNVNAKIKNFSINHQGKGATTQMFLYPVSELRLHSQFKDGKPSGGRIEIVRVFTIIAIFILLIACINFMNLSTARSEKRAKEVGIRKVAGALRQGLIGQFLAESVLIAFIAGVLALVIVQLSLHSFNNLTRKELYVGYGSLYSWLTFFAFIFVTGILAGSYPAFFLSSFKPSAVLKGAFKKAHALVTPRKVLVVLQFTFAIILIICTIIVEQQLKYGQDRENGYDKNNLVYVFMTGDVEKKYTAIKEELLQKGIATSISKTSSPITQSWSNTWGINWQGKPANDKTIINNFCSDGNLVTVTGMKVVEGRDIDLKKYPGDSMSVVLNEASVKIMGFKHPVGQVLSYDTNYTVVGVVKDFIMESPYEPIRPIAIFGPHEMFFNTMHIKLSKNNTTANNLAAMEKIFKQYNPQYPFEYHFVDEVYAQKFEEEKLTGILAALFGGLTVFIACLGLFGLAAYMAENRLKEIGVRKVLGASVTGITTLLSIDFIKLVLISIFCATPVAWWAMDSWLKGYEYHTSISWMVFVGAGIIAVVIAILTVSFQAIKAAVANPVKSLRSE